MASWESIYQAGKQLNRYPFSDIVSLIFQMKRDNPALKVLELGCGAGNNVVFMASESVTCAAIDCSKSAIDFAQARLSERNLNADLKVGCFTDLPWPDECFDLVIDRSALNCVPKPQIEVALQQVLRVLRPKGRLFSQMYADSHPAHNSALNATSEFTTGFRYEGYQDIDGLYFASEKDVTLLFGGFEKVNIALSTSQTLSGNILSAQWSISAFKPDTDQVG
ncbi:class I SAM-dependent methyltransferase [Pseudoalteromonas luteoviolacea]|uniref:class I SAM-dependent methyltransferase n=1 Tax=Pseudoalteromonas luteoviolacea TaxID=43657 RepID=UPI001B392AE6|nr:class I SAM-dependent methyltransferase [Pseudoalteromonas luteoviolacea]MBQ4836976.1 class I SAM-dependent methyltransferase [Pseudoalteromonas luteoviolacea]